jgi:hypothetical protein
MSASTSALPVASEQVQAGSDPQGRPVASAERLRTTDMELRDLDRGGLICPGVVMLDGMARQRG